MANLMTDRVGELVDQARPVVDNQFRPLVANVPGAAEMLLVSPATIRRMIENGSLPVCRVGTSLRIPVSAIQALVAASCATPEVA